ncbi:MAG TPA: type II toxin-antitoxin system VapC family toxin [Acidobacteriaceae bacterium]|jgi:predicted nucleic-acid-binding protein|nr:type II toxin-antitoxin system VapC family toxin [Acidobacteriaceae bacterium]
MIGLDTNVVVRYLMQDDVVQSALANRLIDALTEASPGYISLICLAELYWVLDHTYKLTRTEIIQAIRGVITSETLLLQDSELVKRAFYMYSKGNVDFDDCLIAQCAFSASCNSIMTFDKVAAKNSGMQLLA